MNGWRGESLGGRDCDTFWLNALTSERGSGEGGVEGFYSKYFCVIWYFENEHYINKKPKKGVV